MMNDARIYWVQRAMSAAQRLLELRDDLETLSQQHFLGLYGDNTTGILDADLANLDQFKHMSKAEFDTWIAEINGLITAIGAKSDANAPAGASLKLLG